MRRIVPLDRVAVPFLGPLRGPTGASSLATDTVFVSGSPAERFGVFQSSIKCGKNRLESLVIKLLSSRTPIPAAWSPITHDPINV